MMDEPTELSLKEVFLKFLDSKAVLVVKNIPAEGSTVGLQNYLEVVCKALLIHLSHTCGSNRAVVAVFEKELTDVGACVTKTRQRKFYDKHVDLQALGSVSGLVIPGIKSKSITEDALQYYFESKSRSGGEEECVDKVQIYQGNSDKYGVVYINNTTVITSILSRGQHTLCEENIDVQPYFPSIHDYVLEQIRQTRQPMPPTASLENQCRQQQQQQQQQQQHVQQSLNIVRDKEKPVAVVPLKSADLYLQAHSNLLEGQKWPTSTVHENHQQLSDVQFPRPLGNPPMQHTCSVPDTALPNLPIVFEGERTAHPFIPPKPNHSPTLCSKSQVASTGRPVNVDASQQGGRPKPRPRPRPKPRPRKKSTDDEQSQESKKTFPFMEEVSLDRMKILLLRIAGFSRERESDDVRIIPYDKHVCKVRFECTTQEMLVKMKLQMYEILDNFVEKYEKISECRWTLLSRHQNKEFVRKLLIEKKSRAVVEPVAHSKEQVTSKWTLLCAAFKMEEVENALKILRDNIVAESVDIPSGQENLMSNEKFLGLFKGLNTGGLCVLVSTPSRKIFMESFDKEKVGAARKQLLEFIKESTPKVCQQQTANLMLEGAAAKCFKEWLQNDLRNRVRSIGGDMEVVIVSKNNPMKLKVQVTGDAAAMKLVKDSKDSICYEFLDFKKISFEDKDIKLLYKVLDGVEGKTFFRTFEATQRCFIDVITDRHFPATKLKVTENFSLKSQPNRANQTTDEPLIVLGDGDDDGGGNGGNDGYTESDSDYAGLYSDDSTDEDSDHSDEKIAVEAECSDDDSPRREAQMQAQDRYRMDQFQGRYKSFEAAEEEAIRQSLMEYGKHISQDDEGLYQELVDFPSVPYRPPPPRIRPTKQPRFGLGQRTDLFGDVSEEEDMVNPSLVEDRMFGRADRGPDAGSDIHPISSQHLVDPSMFDQAMYGRGDRVRRQWSPPFDDGPVRRVPKYKEPSQRRSDKTIKIGETDIVLRQGKIAGQKAAALVNIVAPSKNFTESIVSRSFAQAGGEELTQMWNNQDFLNSGTVNYVNVTRSGNLRCDYVLHVTLEKHPDEVQMQQCLCRVMREIFQVCMPGAISPKGQSYIAIPPLGIGRLYKYPLKMVARCMFTETHRFLQTRQFSLQARQFSPKEVKFVVFDVETFDAFKTMLDTYSGGAGTQVSQPVAAPSPSGYSNNRNMHSTTSKGFGHSHSQTGLYGNQGIQVLPGAMVQSRSAPVLQQASPAHVGRSAQSMRNTQPVLSTPAAPNKSSTASIWKSAGQQVIYQRRQTPDSRKQGTSYRGGQNYRGQWRSSDRQNPDGTTQTKSSKSSTSKPRKTSHHPADKPFKQVKVKVFAVNSDKCAKACTQLCKEIRENFLFKLTVVKRDKLSSEGREKIIDVLKKYNVKCERGAGVFILRGYKQTVKDANAEILNILLADTAVAANSPKVRRKKRKQLVRGSREFVLHMAEEDEETPYYWSNYKPGGLLKTVVVEFKKLLTNKKHHKVLIGADNPVYAAILNLINKTWDPSKVGQGSDARGLDARPYGLHVVKIERIENIDLYKTYAAYRKKHFVQLLRKERGHFSSLKSIRNSTGDIQTIEHTGRVLQKDMYWEVNEQLFFHGTKADIVDKICDQGLDSRVGDDKAMLGPGVYGAESSTKADQYTDPKSQRTFGPGQHKKMFLIRMALGNMYVCTEPKKFKRPPCSSCCKSDCKDSSHSELFDSVVGDVKKMFREFVVYSKDLCYPEYLITYERV